ncbi:hypothetical protein A9Q80_01490 [Cycloclasticus sp. 46_83_sub15_T18]|nr:hypothetical protein A9Q80_01490 [Cycloclasticus sp. 46_83_sub15_T18]
MSFPIFSAEQVRQMEQQAMQQTGVTAFELMQRAGQALFQQLQQILISNQLVHVFCGAGNNAGDGYVLARLLLEAGFKPRVYALLEPSRLGGEALRAMQDYQQLGKLISQLPATLEPGVIVDALIGTGLSKPLAGEYLAAAHLMNNSGLVVLSVDLPSGVAADTGLACKGAVRADTTLSFVALKRGLYTADGLGYAGEVLLDDLSLSQCVLAGQVADAQLLVFELLKKSLSARAKNSHKGDYGHILLVGGATAYSGAIRLAGEASLRAGAGLVSIATRPEHAAFMNVSRPELMCHGVSSATDLQRLMERCSVLAIGPGLGQTDWSQELFNAALTIDKPMVIDADGLNLLAKTAEKRDNWVLTPHPAEAARLLSCSTADVQGDRFAAVRCLQRQYGGVVVLKGAGSLIDDGQLISVCTAGNPGMASGGMGDVLTGVIAALLGQQYNISVATKLAVMIHAMAGDRAAINGERGLLASDLMQAIRELVNDY